MLSRAAHSLLRKQASLHTGPALQKAATAVETSQLQGVLGLSGAEVQNLLAARPELANEKPSVLAERWQFLTTGLGIPQDRLRSLLREKPALLSDANIRELRSMAGLSD